MVATLTRRQPTSKSDPRELRFSPRTARRRPILAVSSALLVAVCITVFASVYLHAGHQVSALAIAHPVAQGQILADNDLTVVRLSLSPAVAAISASSAANIVGRRAAVALEPGALLVPADLADLPSPPSGYAITGVAVKQSQMPASGVVPGDAVDVVMTEPPGTPYSATGNDVSEQSESEGVSGAGTILAPDVLVTEVNSSSLASGSDTVIVSLEIPRTLAPIIASASAAGEAALVVVAPGL